MSARNVFEFGEGKIMADLNDWYPGSQPSLGNVATGGRAPGAPSMSANGAGASLSANVGGSVGAPALWVLGIVAASLLLLHLE